MNVEMSIVIQLDKIYGISPSLASNQPGITLTVLFLGYMGKND